jgi:hypothetical protein
VAFGEFQASDIVYHSVCQSDFTNIEPVTNVHDEKPSHKQKPIRPIKTSNHFAKKEMKSDSMLE